MIKSIFRALFKKPIVELKRDHGHKIATSIVFFRISALMFLFVGLLLNPYTGIPLILLVILLVAREIVKD